MDSLFWAAAVLLLAMPVLLFLRARSSGLGRSDPVLTDAPCHHVVPGEVAEFMIPDFRPGIDTCRIELRDPDAEFDAVLDDAGVRFQFLDGNSFLEVVFPGLGRPPFADTWIFGPGAAAAGSVLSDLVGAEPPEKSAHFHRVRSQIAAFQKFSAEDEVIEVWVPPDAATLPRIDVRATADGSDGEVVIDGRPAARLCGAPGAGVENIRIIRKHVDDVYGDGQIWA